MMNDRQLLDQYLGTHSESAFSELLARNVDLVYSAALRLVELNIASLQNRRPHDAEDAVVGDGFQRYAVEFNFGVEV